MHAILNRSAAWATALATVSAVAGSPAGAQTLMSVNPAPATVVVPQPSGSDGGWAEKFFRDVGGDYKHFFSVETALWLGAGGVAALAVHPSDQAISDAAKNETNTLTGGSVYGSEYLQIPVAVAWWAIAAAAGSERHAETGRDLLRAQISVASWTSALKLASDRTRPNGDPYSFPSGHASAFAAAMVLQNHYGWKVGLPAFIAAGYTAASRVVDNQHWTSDVLFGVALGVACARTVTIKYRESRVSMVPFLVPKGGGLIVSVVR